MGHKTRNKPYHSLNRIQHMFLKQWNCNQYSERECSVLKKGALVHVHVRLFSNERVQVHLI